MEREEREKIGESKGFKGVALVRALLLAVVRIDDEEIDGSGGRAPVAWSGPDMRVPHVSEWEGEKRARLLLGRCEAGCWAGLPCWPGWAFFSFFFLTKAFPFFCFLL